MAEQLFSSAEAADMLGIPLRTFQWRVVNLGIKPALIGKKRTNYYSASQLVQVSECASAQVRKSAMDDSQVRKCASAQVDNDPKIENGDITPISKSASRQVGKSTMDDSQVGKSASRQVGNEPKIENGDITPISKSASRQVGKSTMDDSQVGKSASRQVGNDPKIDNGELTPTFESTSLQVSKSPTGLQVSNEVSKSPSLQQVSNENCPVMLNSTQITEFENANAFQIISNLPQELLKQKRFFKVGKDKVPLVKAWSNPDNQCFAHDVDGLAGFDTSGHDLAVDYLLIDFDHVLDDNGKFINKKAEFWYNFCAKSGSYCEISISGHGIHIILKVTPGKFSPTANGKSGVLQLGDGAKIELFYKTKGRYCLLTGKVFNCNPNSPITGGNTADDIFQAILDEIKKQNLAPAKDSKTKQPTFEDILIEFGSDYDLFRAQKMLDEINPVDLADSEWLAVMSACKNIGIPYYVVDSFNQRDPNRYKETENQRRWDSLNDANYDIETLHGIAKRYSYSEKDARREWFQFHPELSSPKKSFKHKENFSQAEPPKDKKIADWEKTNGIINPQRLGEIQKFIASVANVDDFLAVASDTSNQKFFGYCRFYPFADVEQKFSEGLRIAVSRAKAKVKAWNKHVADTDKYNLANIGAKRDYEESKRPTLSESTLAAFKPRVFEEAVESYSKKAKREHEKWLVQHKCDEINAQREAEREAYEDAPPTTQQGVADCPIDLILPDGAIFSDNGIMYVEWNKPAKDGRPHIEVCQNPIVPTKDLFNAELGLSFYEVAIKKNNRWQFKIFPARNFFDARSVAELTNHGLKISEPRLLANFFSKFFQMNEQNQRLPQKRLYSKPGWHDGEFILPTGTDDYIVSRDGIDYKNIFDTKGDKDAWLDTFKGIFKFGQEISKAEWENILCWVYVCGVALNAPVLKVAGLPNQQVHFWGDRSFAKTAAVKFALSIFGNPTEGKLLRNMAATDKNKLTFSAGMNDFAVGYDEAESANKFADIEKSSYDFFSGVINQANKRNGEVRPAEHFRGVQIMTGENPVLEIDTAKGGAIKRLIQIQVTTPFLDVEAAGALHNFLADNHGHFRETWIEYIVAHQENFKQDIKLTLEALKGSDEFDISECESTNAHAVTSAFVSFFHFLVMLGFKDEVDCELVAQYATPILKNLPSISEVDDFDRVRLLIKSYIDSRVKFFYRESYSVDHSAARNEPFEKYGIILRNGDVAFFTGSFKKTFDELGIKYSYARFLINSYTRGFLDGMSQRNKFKSIRYNGEKVNVYYFRAATFRNDDDIDDDTDKEYNTEHKYYEDYHNN